MSKLVRKRDAYRAALARAEVLRAAYLEEIGAQRATGRTLDDIGTELGVSRSRVLRLLDGRGRR